MTYPIQPVYWDAIYSKLPNIEKFNDQITLKKASIVCILALSVSLVAEQSSLARHAALITAGSIIAAKALLQIGANVKREIWRKTSEAAQLIYMRSILLNALRNESPELSHCQTLEEALQNKKAILKITDLALKGANHACSLPPEIGQLTNLKKLELSHYKLERLPSEIERLTNLTWLSLGNELEGLSPEIERLTNLTSLDISCNKLERLPPEIGRLTNLKKLGLSLNRLEILPPEIGRLTNLKDLNLSFNRLEILPPEIGRLTNLKTLHLCANKLERLPEIEQITELWLSHSKLERLPPGIERLTNLQRLFLNQNKLEILPPEIGRLTNLTGLNLDCNKLERLPPEIGRLIKLIKLDLSNNPTLNGLPLQILDLPQTCEIDITGCSLSEEVLNRLRNVCNAPGYQGPRISFSMAHAEYERPGKSIEEILKELFSYLKQPYELLSHTLGADVDQPALQAWLNNLSYLKDFQGRPETKQWLISNIVKYLKLANQDQQFRREFSSIIQGAAATCGDRVALSVIHLGIHYQLATIDLKDMKKLAEFLAKGVFAMSLLENIARNKVETLPFFDEIEVYLAYPVMLKERLGLPINIEGMLHYGCSEVKQDDLDAAADFVTNKLKNTEEFYLFLINQQKWKEALTANFPQEYGLLLKARDDGSNAHDPDYEKLQRELTAGLMALTKRALE